MNMYESHGHAINLDSYSIFREMTFWTLWPQMTPVEFLGP